MPIADRIWPLSISTRIGYCHLTTESPSARWIFAYTRQPTKVSRKRSCSDAAQIGFFEVSNCIASWFFVIVLVLVLSVSGTRTRCGIFEYDYEYHFIEYEYEKKPKRATSKLVRCHESESETGES